LKGQESEMHAILMGDPRFFHIKGGANPYTRTSWGFRKRVEQARALEQWQRLKETFESLDVRVLVSPAMKHLPGSVFPANAGFLYPKYQSIKPSQKIFYLSHLTAHRYHERDVFRHVLAPLGFAFHTLPYAFEGEADFFPCADFFIFSYGTVRSTGFRPRLGWPPLRYQFSHRSDERNVKMLQKIVCDKPVVKIFLSDVRYYHGDTCLFAFGRNREYLLAYLPALARESQDELRRRLGKRLIPLSESDAQNFVANSFQVDTKEGPHLVIPSQTSSEAKQLLSKLGFPHSAVDVSEFFTKGGGSIKCLLCDLGPIEL
jgi:N-dimethylarginine dimethylaminohydrolase